jgi:hypothetical protein
MASIYLYTTEVSPNDIKLQNVVDDTLPPIQIPAILNDIYLLDQSVVYGRLRVWDGSQWVVKILNVKV